MYSFLVGKPEGKRPLGRPRRRCVNNIRNDLRGDGCVWGLGGETRGKETIGDT